MIKNATIYKITQLSFDVLEKALEQAQFAPTGPTQAKAIGWVPPRGEEHGALVESNSGALVFQLKVETRKVPAATLADELAKVVQNIEQNTGRKPGKKEKRDLKEELILSLLPKAFPVQKTVMCIADDNRLILGTTSGSLADDVLTAMVKLIDGFVAESLNTVTSPSTAMAMWLAEQEPPEGFSIGRACELRACDESSAKVRYTNHPLLTDEVLAHIAQGKLPTSLALEFDDRVEFVLTDSMQLKKIVFGDEVLERVRENGVNPGDFDGSMAIAIGEFRPLLAELVASLGGFAQTKTEGA
jgi:recombination associated protein RdgC